MSSIEISSKALLQFEFDLFRLIKVFIPLNFKFKLTVIISNILPLHFTENCTKITDFVGP